MIFSQLLEDRGSRIPGVSCVFVWLPAGLLRVREGIPVLVALKRVKGELIGCTLGWPVPSTFFPTYIHERKRDKRALVWIKRFSRGRF